MMFAALLLAAAGPVCEASWHDGARNRDVPVRIRMPAGTGKAPVILFSHGLGGSLDAGTIWAKAWADAGFIVVHVQHPGSDLAGLRANGLRGAMAPEQLIARVGDVKLVISRLEAHGSEGACDLTRADTDHIGMSGHSFGAHTTLAVSGQRFAQGSSIGDKRVKAGIAFSPAPTMRPGVTDADSFGAIRIPLFSLTGSLDAVPITPVTAEDRIRPFHAMPPGGKYLLWFDGANHAAFGGQGFSGHGTAPDSHVQPIVIRMTTLFWRWTLKGDMAAKAELDAGDSALGPQDRFERR